VTTTAAANSRICGVMVSPMKIDASANVMKVQCTGGLHGGHAC
jgi:hypothetical protein